MKAKVLGSGENVFGAEKYRRGMIRDGEQADVINYSMAG